MNLSTTAGIQTTATSSGHRNRQQLESYTFAWQGGDRSKACLFSPLRSKANSREQIWFRKVQEVCRIHFHLFWYLFVFMVPSYDQKPKANGTSI